MEFVIGSISAIGAVCFTNPLEVIKTRFQLQGELQSRGKYQIYYKNFFHAGWVIARKEGLLALQKGLVPSIWHQVLLNGSRLGGYQIAEERKLNLNSKGEVSFGRTVAIGAVMGLFGAYSGSPLYLVKTRLQSQAAASIAVGYQHEIAGMTEALKSIYKAGGITGLWRGVVGSIPRMMVGSATQLSTFLICKEYLEMNQYYKIEKGLLNTFVAAMVGGIAVAITMGPLDVISTRLYNQGVDKHGRGLLYSSYFDCVKKIWATESFTGFYKGIIPCYMRIGPHTVLCMIFWDQLKALQYQLYPSTMSYNIK